jgi:hypothetical protein
MGPRGVNGRSLPVKSVWIVFTPLGFDCQQVSGAHNTRQLDKKSALFTQMSHTRGRRTKTMHVQPCHNNDEAHSLISVWTIPGPHLNPRPHNSRVIMSAQANRRVIPSNAQETTRLFQNAQTFVRLH